MPTLCSRSVAPRLFKSLPFLAFAGGGLLVGCSRPTSPTNSTTQPTASTTKTPVTGQSAQETARPGGQPLGTPQPSPQVPVAYRKKRMDSRLKVLSAQPVTSSKFGALSFYGVQSVTLQDLPKVAANFDAATCRSYAAQLEALDARVPSYGVLLKQEEADNIRRLNLRMKNPKAWKSLISRLGRTPDAQVALNKMSAAQITANIQKIYNAAIAASAKPYSSQPISVPVDPYTSALASPSDMGRFLWTKFKTDRVLAIAALRQRIERLENQSLTVAPLNDPFGTGPLEEKGEVIYSVGPDTKDDGGKPALLPALVQQDDKGDILAPKL